MTTIVICLVICYFSKREYELPQVKDKCIDRPKYQYLITMSYEKKRLITRFSTPPKVLIRNSYYVSSHTKGIRFILNRDQPLNEVHYIRLNHNSYNANAGIGRFEMRDMKTADGLEAKVKLLIKPINVVDMINMNYQMLPLNKCKEKVKIANLLPAPEMRWFEFMVFLLGVINLIPFLMQYFHLNLEKPYTCIACSDKRSLNNILLCLSTGLVINTISLAIALVLLYIYYKMAKNYNKRVINRTSWLAIRYIWLSVIVMLLMTMAITMSAQSYLSDIIENTKYYTRCLVYVYCETMAIGILIGLLLCYTHKCVGRKNIDRYYSENFVHFLSQESNHITDMSEIMGRETNSLSESINSKKTTGQSTNQYNSNKKTISSINESCGAVNLVNQQHQRREDSHTEQQLFRDRQTNIINRYRLNKNKKYWANYMRNNVTNGNRFAVKKSSPIIKKLGLYYLLLGSALYPYGYGNGYGYGYGYGGVNGAYGGAQTARRRRGRRRGVVGGVGRTIRRLFGGQLGGGRRRGK
ncbi:uncharacterized protein LOC128963349 [Oppia nitens]|uniref:uncharacterized protein LOC128963349 n=1 Tax=Oppia nitens TaxID=1686743 RepID=UPI0023DC6945|nr:uncharacterized protein LOC128963349 [Oppia nitens]